MKAIRTILPLTGHIVSIRGLNRSETLKTPLIIEGRTMKVILKYKAARVICIYCMENWDYIFEIATKEKGGNVTHICEDCLNVLVEKTENLIMENDHKVCL